jgi:hypothetical protein
LDLSTPVGNSDTQNINAKLGLSDEAETWLHKANLGFLRSEADDEFTTEKYNVSLQSDRKLDVRLGEVFSWKLSETAEFNQFMSVEGGDENTSTKAGLSIKSALTGTLALKVGIAAKHTDEVPD